MDSNQLAEWLLAKNPKFKQAAEQFKELDIRGRHVNHEFGLKENRLREYLPGIKSTAIIDDIAKAIEKYTMGMSQ